MAEERLAKALANVQAELAAWGVPPLPMEPVCSGRECHFKATLPDGTILSDIRSKNQALVVCAKHAPEEHHAAAAALLDAYNATTGRNFKWRTRRERVRLQQAAGPSGSVETHASSEEEEEPASDDGAAFFSAQAPIPLQEDNSAATAAATPVSKLLPCGVSDGVDVGIADDVEGLAHIVEESADKRAALRAQIRALEEEGARKLATYVTQVDAACQGYAARLQGALEYKAPSNGPTGCKSTGITALVSSAQHQVAAALEAMHASAAALKRTQEEAALAARAERVATLNAEAELELKKWRKARELLRMTPEGLKKLQQPAHEVAAASANTTRKSWLRLF